MRHIFLLVFTFFVCNLLQSQVGLTFQFTNPTLIGTAPNVQLQFDIAIKASVVGTFHSNGQVYFSYNTNAFGSSVFGNGKVSVQKLDLLLGDLGGSDKYEVIQNDNSANIFAITWISSFAGGGPNTTFLNEVSTSYLPLMRITIDITDDSQLAGITFVENLMNGQQFYRQASNSDLQYTIPSDYENNLNNQALPIDLLSFTAISATNYINLHWSALEVADFNGYELQRSTDGKNFRKIAFIKGSTKDAIQQYDFADFQIDFNQPYYYRLKMIDLDSNFEFSRIESAIIESFTEKILVYPNPVSNLGILKIQSTFNGNLEISIFNEIGKLVGAKTIPNGNGIINVENLPKGAYVYRIIGLNYIQNGVVILK